MAHKHPLIRLALLVAITTLSALVLSGCSSPKPAPDGFQIVELDGTEFTLELVAEDNTRIVGLGGRTELEPTGGMLFSFPNARVRNFIMRDCVIDIDILFLDAGGRIVAMHTMKIEPPRETSETDRAYDARLKQYSSRYAAQYAIEIRGGLLESMDLSTGDKIELDLVYLKSVTD